MGLVSFLPIFLFECVLVFATEMSPSSFPFSSVLFSCLLISSLLSSSHLFSSLFFSLLLISSLFFSSLLLISSLLFFSLSYYPPLPLPSFSFSHSISPILPAFLSTSSSYNIFSPSLFFNLCSSFTSLASSTVPLCLQLLSHPIFTAPLISLFTPLFYYSYFAILYSF